MQQHYVKKIQYTLLILKKCFIAKSANHHLTTTGPTNLQLIEHTIPAKCNEVKCNKSR